MKISRYLWGILFMLAGMLYLLNNLGAINIPNNIFDYWPVILIVIGLSSLFERGSSITFNIVLVGAGLLLLLHNIVGLRINVLEIIFASILFAIGLKIIFPSHIAPKLKMDESFGEKVSHFDIFSGGQTKVISDNFKYGDFSAVFGGSEINLVNATISPDGAYIYAKVAFGGIDIIVPAGTQVTTKGFIVFGGVENKYKNNAPPNSNKIIVDVTGVFGGIDIIYI